VSTVLITGARRAALGLDFTKQYAAKGWKVHACARAPGKPEVDEGRHPCPHTRSPPITRPSPHWGTKLSGEAIDVLICNAGRGAGRGGQDRPGAGDLRRFCVASCFRGQRASAPFDDGRKPSSNTWRAPQQRKMIAIFEYSRQHRPQHRRPLYLSWRARRRSTWNGNCLAKDLEPKGMICVALHPGWVQTDMGGATATLTIEQSVSSMVKVIDGLKAVRQRAPNLQYDGGELPW